MFFTYFIYLKIRLKYISHKNTQLVQNNKYKNNGISN